MTRNRSRVMKAVAGGAAVVGVLAGCTATTGPGEPSTPPPSTGSSPQVTESNPPGDIPDNQAFVAYTAPDQSFTVKYPEGWARTDSGATVMFSDKYNSMTVAPHDGFYQPTEAYARTVEIPEIASATAGFNPGQVSTVTRPPPTSWGRR
ncbi:MAG: hypothetical protein ACSLE6_13695 [Mycobacterium sp.]